LTHLVLSHCVYCIFTYLQKKNCKYLHVILLLLASHSSELPEQFLLPTIRFLLYIRFAFNCAEGTCTESQHSIEYSPDGKKKNSVVIDTVKFTVWKHPIQNNNYLRRCSGDGYLLAGANSEIHQRRCIAVNGYLIKSGAPMTMFDFLIVVLMYTGGRGYI
jgi:hypothetical protein